MQTLKTRQKPRKKKENKHGKTRNARQALTQAKANVRQRQESKQSEKTAKQHSKKPRAKNSNKNKTTICVHKSAKKAQTTQGKRQTPDFIAINPKTPAHQTASAQNGATEAKQLTKANLGNSKTLANKKKKNPKNFRFQFKKKN